MNEQAGSTLLARYTVNVGLNLLAGLAGFLVVVFIGRFHGAEGLGQVSLALAILAYAETVTNCGTEVHAVRVVAADPTRLLSIGRAVLALRLALGLLSYACMMVLVFAVPSFRELLPLSAVFGLLLFSAALSPAWMAQATHRTGIYVALGSMIPCGYLLLVALFSRFFSSMLLVPVALVSAHALSTAAAWGWARRQLAWTPGRVAWRAVVATLRRSAPLGVARLFRGLALGSDLVLLGLLVSATELGHYTTAYKMYLFLLALAGSYFIILLPRLAERAGRSAVRMQTEMLASLKRVFPLALAGALLLYLLGGWLIAWAFGPSFVVAVPALHFLLIAFLAHLLHRHYIQALVAMGFQDRDMLLSALAAALHIGWKLALIPRLGMAGAALGSALGEILIALVYALTVHRLVGHRAGSGSG